MRLSKRQLAVHFLLAMAFLALSYIFAPFGHIEAVRNKMITLNNEEIPIGTSYEKSFFERFV